MPLLYLKKKLIQNEISHHLSMLNELGTSGILGTIALNFCILKPEECW